ncbi:protein FAM161A isoform X2 [Acomys russatus]|uniref:protein FAM161A isoform X2 n=1 Tax=Acomys russatus TaxID=60746 RepID=UPI0021E3402A|nr:protein FAM161A isoform X2 [Acomys russatus]
MSSPNRAAKQAAASLHLPVNPTTGERVAQYEREDSSLESVVAAALAAAVEEEVKSGKRPAQASAGSNNVPGEDKSVALEDIMNLADIYNSDKEYFRKLKKLKAAHAESMAKLAKMYKDKLNIRELHPATTREESSSASCSSASEKNRPPPFLLVTFSEPDLGRPPSLSTTSDEEPPSLEKETPRESRMRAYARELINNMWNDFSVRDYIQNDSDFKTPKKTRKKPKSWVPRITVPVPFQMVVRDQKRREGASKARSDLEMRQKLPKRDEDEAECKKKFRANPVPSRILLPLYEELLREEEERRRIAKERSKAALLAAQKPFKFMDREEQKQAAREKLLRDLFKAKRKTKRFKARPVPHFIYRPVANYKSAEELSRNTRMQPKARDQPQGWSRSYRPAYRQFRVPRSPGRPRHRCRCWSPDEDYTGDDSEKGRGPSSAPSFLSGSMFCKHCSLLKPRSERQKVLADKRANEETLKETRWPYPSPRRESPARSVCANPRPLQSNPPMPTVSSRGREQAIRKSEKARMNEYRRELEEQDEKLQNRLMLFERVAQRNARMAAEQHYSNTLRALGLSEEFVSEKGQSGKVSGTLTRRELRSCTADKESSPEEESANEEENCLTDTNSPDSCRESKEDVKESGDENSQG